MVAFLGLLNQLISSSYSRSYIYPVPNTEVNCSGTVNAVEYCYTGSQNQFGTEQLVFTLSILNQSGSSITVINTKDVISTPNDGKCTLRSFSSIQYCCDVTSLSVADQFQLPASNFAFGITIPSSGVNLLGWSPSRYPDFIVNHYVEDFPLTNGNTYMLNNIVIDQAHRLLRFHISKLLSY